MNNIEYIYKFLRFISVYYYYLQLPVGLMWLSDGMVHFLKIKNFFLSNLPKLSCGFKLFSPTKKKKKKVWQYEKERKLARKCIPANCPKFPGTVPISEFYKALKSGRPDFQIFLKEKIKFYEFFFFKVYNSTLTTCIVVCVCVCVLCTNLMQCEVQCGNKVCSCTYIALCMNQLFCCILLSMTSGYQRYR